MTIKVCTNVSCPAYAHVVYTVAQRCNLCRCDLKGAQRTSDDSTVQPRRSYASPSPRRSLRVGGTRIAR
jgi:hypothetical protein